MRAHLVSLTRRLAGAAILAVLLGGVPSGLIHYVGWPLPDHLPGWHELTAVVTSPLTDALLGNTLACLLWLAWAAFAWSVLTEAVGVLAGIRLPQPRAFAPARGLAALLVAAITGGVLTAGAHPAQTRPQATVAAAPHHTAASTVVVTRPPDTVADRLTAAGMPTVAIAVPAAPAGTVTFVAAGQHYTCVVHRGDTLSDIAERWLGDANRWPEIFALNRGTHFVGVGGTFTSPHLIYPGWTLRLPDDAIPPTEATPVPAPPVAPDPAPPVPPAGSSPSGTVPAPDDGVVPATPAATAPPTAAQSESAPAPAASRPAPPRPGVELPGGSWVDLGLATAIAALAATVWLLRRRRYTPRPPTAQLRLDDPDLAPLPPVVTAIRRALRRPDESNSPTGDDANPDQATAATLDGAQPTTADPTPLPWPQAGLSLTGPGAEAAARGFLTTALAAGDPVRPHTHTRVVVPAGTLATLLGARAVDVTDTPRLTVTADLQQALDLLDTHTLHRSRLLYAHEVADVAALREADPDEEPLPSLLLITDSDAVHEHARIGAMLTQGSRLGISGVLLGSWPDEATIHVANDGTIAADPDESTRARAQLGRLTVVGAAETADLLRTLAEVHTGRPQPPAPAEPATAAPPHPAHNDEKTTDASLDRAYGTDPDTPEDFETTGPAQVFVLGNPRIDDDHITDANDLPLRPKSLELLVYLALHVDSVGRDQILEDLLPDAPRSKAPHRLHTYVYNLRQNLKRAGGEADHVLHPPGRYRLNRDTVDTDLWRLQAALAAAAAAGDTTVRVAALRDAVNSYIAPLAADRDYEWIEPYREALRRKILDAHLALAEHLAGDPAEAVAVVESAIRHDPYAEALYLNAMQLHARLGSVDGIRRLRRDLTSRLSEIDAEPDDATVDVADRLVSDLLRRPRRPSSLPRPDAA